jgi:hypothetical protein
MREKKQDLLKINKDLQELSWNLKQKVDLTTTELSPLVTSFFLKARKSHAAIMLLATQNFGEDSLILSRSLFEMVVTLKYILLDKNKYSRWREHDWIDRKRILNIVNSENVKLVENIRNEADRVKDEYNYGRYDWSDKNIRQMSEDVGLFPNYQTLYQMQCGMSHNSPRCVHHFLEGHKEGQLDISKENVDYQYLETSLTAGFENFLIITDIFAREFNLDINKKFKSLVNRLVKIINH